MKAAKSLSLVNFSGDFLWISLLMLLLQEKHLFIFSVWFVFGRYSPLASDSYFYLNSLCSGHLLNISLQCLIWTQNTDLNHIFKLVVFKLLILQGWWWGEVIAAPWGKNQTSVLLWPEMSNKILTYIRQLIIKKIKNITL